MKVFLVTYAGQRRFFDMYIPDPGIAQIAAVLKKSDIEITIYDLNLVGNSFGIFLNNIRVKKPDIIAFKFFDTGFSGVIQLAKTARTQCPNVKIIGVGPHITLFREHILHCTDVFDFIVIGEGEVTASQIIEYIEGRRSIYNVSNVIFRNSNGNIITTKREIVEDLDEMPMPAWDMLDLERYFPLILLNGRRGCPNSCAFCAHNHLWGDDSNMLVNGSIKVRKKSINRIIKETKYAINKLGARLFGFTDSLPEYKLLVSWAEYLIMSNCNAGWSSFAAVNQFNETDLKILSKSGCKSLWIGVESGDKNQLIKIGKTYNNDDVINTFKNLRDVGIVGVAGFVMGFPGETIESINNTLNLIDKLESTISVISPFILDPGSPIARYPERYDVELVDDWQCKIIKRDELNEFEIPYYKVSNQWNDKLWAKIMDSTNYMGWNSDRTIAESEHAAVIAWSIGLTIDEFVEDATASLAHPNHLRIQELVNRVWKSM
jgi:radical SAM superfamily enzyme YgiQ (UPF0313 family)